MGETLRANDRNTQPVIKVDDGEPWPVRHYRDDETARRAKAFLGIPD